MAPSVRAADEPVREPSVGASRGAIGRAVDEPVRRANELAKSQAARDGQDRRTRGGCATFGDSIVTENALPGSPPSQWDISGAGDSSIEGFATDISVNRGATVDFKIDTPSIELPHRHLPARLLRRRRARLVDTIPPSATRPTTNRRCLFDAPATST